MLLMDRSIAIVKPPKVSKISTEFPTLGHGIITASVKDKFDVTQIDMEKRLRILNGSKLKKNEIDILAFNSISKVLDFLEEDDKLLKKEVNKLIQLGNLDSFDVICFSVLFLRSLNRVVLPLCKVLKRMNKTIVIGGCGLDFSNPVDIANLDFVDYVVHGSGERCLPIILDKELNGSDIELPPEVYTSSDEIDQITNKYEHPLNEQPIPYFSKEIIEMYKHRIPLDKIVIPYQIDRHCSKQCSFCQFSPKKKHEHKNIDKIISDIKKLKEKYNTNLFFFCSDNFLNDPEFIMKLSEEIISRDLDIQFGGNAEIIKEDYSFFEKLSNAGCRFMMLGLESGSNRILRKMRKPHTSEMASRMIRLMDSTGINPRLLLMVGFPYETREDFLKTKNFVKEHSNNFKSASVSEFTVVKESLIYKNPKKFGLSIREDFITDMKQSDIRKVIFENMWSKKRYKFDEIEGLKWEEKRFLQRKRRKELDKTTNTIYFKKGIKDLRNSINIFLRGSLIEQRHYNSYLFTK